MDLETSCALFIDYLRAERSSLPKTVEAYLSDIKGIFSSLSASTVLEIDLASIERWLKKEGACYCSATLARKLVALRLWLSFLIGEGIPTALHPIHLTHPKQELFLPSILREKQVADLLAVVAKETFTDLRDRAILLLLYATGIRVSELCFLKIKDIKGESIAVYGKGEKERNVPVALPALQAIDRYLHHRGEDSNPHLFITERKKTLSRIFVWKMVQKRAKEAGIIESISPHTFRHTFATHLLEHGADTRVIQELLGHARIQTTDRYTHVADRKMVESFEISHPLQEFE